jgi:hypothetical protein
MSRLSGILKNHLLCFSKRRKNLKPLALIGVIMALTCGLAQGQTTSIPQLVNYQGKLTDAYGGALETKEYTLEFNIYDNATAVTVVWGPQIFDGGSATGHGAKVPVVRGYFNVILGQVDTTNRSIAIAFGGPNRYIGIKVDGAAEISPRQQILSTPYALNGVPAGTIVAFGGNTIPPGWLLCNGAAYKSTTYPALYAAILTSWGNGTDDGDVNTNFNVPDLMGRFLRGKDFNNGRDPDRLSRTSIRTGGATQDAVGSLQGEATKKPITDFTTDSPGNHSHGIPGMINYWDHPGCCSGAGRDAWGPAQAEEGWWFSAAAGAHTHTITGGGDNETRPKNANVNWIIKY